MTKRAWRLVNTSSYPPSIQDGFYSDDMISGSEYLTQSDFLREYYPSGHEILDRVKYPDIFREIEEPVYDENGEPTGEKRKRTYVELLPRYTFAFEQVLALKQLIHLAGNETQCELASKDNSEDDLKSYAKLREGWLMKDMEVLLFKAYHSVKCTGDGAIVFYMKDGELHGKCLSFLKGDILYPHEDAYGRMSIFARKFHSQDDSGNTNAEYLEVYDDKYVTLLKRGVGSGVTFKQKFLGLFGVDGYVEVQRSLHGFNRVPVAYFRDEDGPCWSPARSSIKGFEFSFCQMAQNNSAFGFPILTLQGENIEATPDLNGTIKMISLGPDDKAGYLNQQDASGSFFKQLDLFYKMIYETCFVVTPPELKSGDLPAAALKILYSPAYEKATYDAHFFQSFLNDVVSLFTYGYGIECSSTIAFDNVKVKWWIKPYIHVNWSTTISDLAMAVNSGFLSKETASERIPEYATVGEWSRIMEEYKKRQQSESLYQISNTISSKEVE